MKLKLCQHLDGLAHAWARFPEISVIDGNFQIACKPCEQYIDIGTLLKAVEVYEQELRRGR